MLIAGRWVLNFASSHYLGVGRHPSVLRATAGAAMTWGTSLSMPRSLATLASTARLEVELATLTGREKALVFPSTTHAAADVLSVLAGHGGTLLLDRGAYPISFQGAAVAVGAGARADVFGQGDERGLQRQLVVHRATRRKVVVCDGIDTGTGQPMPLDGYANLAQQHRAFLYVDDTHGIGVLGSSPTIGRPYGTGGGGTPQHVGVVPVANVVHVGSLAKGFGLPIAFVAGDGALIDFVRHRAASLTHSSPPSIPTVAAARAAIRVHTRLGEMLRDRLLRRVHLFRERLARMHIPLASNTMLPIQRLRLPTPLGAARLVSMLLKRGVWSAQLESIADNRLGSVMFVITAQHTVADIEEAVARICDSYTLTSAQPPK